MERAIPLLLACLVALGGCHAMPPASGPSEVAAPSAKPSRGRTATRRATARPLGVRCTDTAADVYAAVLPAEGAPPERGAILRCAEDAPLARSEVEGRLGRARVSGMRSTTGARVFRIAYATRRRGDVPGVGTALVYLPDPPARAPSDVAVVAHGTAGMADRCAPSIPGTTSDYLALPWLAHGFAVVAPDYAGLGNAGVQGYLDWEDTGHSALDASRAIRGLAGRTRLGTKDVYVGHSQGAGASLAAQALAPTYGAGGRVAAVVAFAPAFTIDADVTPIAFPFVSTSALGGGPATILSMHFYGFFANRYGEARRGDGFGAAHREAVVEALERDCIFDLLHSLRARRGASASSSIRRSGPRPSRARAVAPAKAPGATTSASCGPTCSRSIPRARRSSTCRERTTSSSPRCRPPVSTRSSHGTESARRSASTTPITWASSGPGAITPSPGRARSWTGRSPLGARRRAACPRARFPEAAVSGDRGVHQRVDERGGEAIVVDQGAAEHVGVHRPLDHAEEDEREGLDVVLAPELLEHEGDVADERLLALRGHPVEGLVGVPTLGEHGVEPRILAMVGDHHLDERAHPIAEGPLELGLAAPPRARRTRRASAPRS